MREAPVILQDARVCRQQAKNRPPWVMPQHLTIRWKKLWILAGSGCGDAVVIRVAGGGGGWCFNRRLWGGSSDMCGSHSHCNRKKWWNLVGSVHVCMVVIDSICDQVLQWKVGSGLGVVQAAIGWWCFVIKIGARWDWWWG
ncbi:Hypothetical predicted protein [Olea europaea subsp. europaea]|uniref:Uncharacterized protein n=1 Tax=Olea europaea subsp. europaea TaxID=158383 RepID=A0A8S0V6W5_OLEEU|nr:Hypothetical predicted protein [Olea europaea subsp. europaea]